VDAGCFGKVWRAQLTTPEGAKQLVAVKVLE
jgi:hypothetical protein